MTKRILGVNLWVHAEYIVAEDDAADDQAEHEDIEGLGCVLAGGLSIAAANALLRETDRDHLHDILVPEGYVEDYPWQRADAEVPA